MVTKPKEDWCQCGDDIPITHLGTCEECGKKYLFPRGRKYVTHPMPFEEAKKMVEQEANRQKKLWGYISWDNSVWRGIFDRLMDGEFFNIHSGYFLMGCGIFCNPRLYHMMELYFNDRRGAEFWRELKFSGALYTLDICEKK